MLNLFLLIYRYFYGYNYKPFVDSTKNGPHHKRVQNLYCLLYYVHINFKLFGNPNNNLYEYTWFNKSPHSRRLEQDLYYADAQIDRIAAFYRDEYENEKLKHLRIIEELDLLKSIFFNDEIIEILKVAKYGTEDWTKVLAVVAFLKNDILPNSGFLTIEKELKHRGILWSGDNGLNHKAWVLLQEAGIIKREEVIMAKIRTGEGVKDTQTDPVEKAVEESDKTIKLDSKAEGGYKLPVWYYVEINYPSDGQG